MKHLLFTVFVLLSATFSYGQVTMKIERVDIARVGGITYQTAIIDASVTGDFIRVEVVVAIENNTQKDVCIENNEDFPVRYHRHRRVYRQYAVWTPGRYRYGLELIGMDMVYLRIKPEDTGKMLFTFVAPKRDPGEYPYDLLQTTFPEGGELRDGMSNVDYLIWLKSILPSLRIIINYSENLMATTKIETLVSEPVDLEKVVVKNNLTKIDFNFKN